MMGEPIEEAVTLVKAARARIKDTLRVLRSTPEGGLGDPREVGRGRLPSTVFGLLFHIAEHTQRHAGQIVTTARVVRGEVFREESSGGEPAGIIRGRIDAD